MLTILISAPWAGAATVTTHPKLAAFSAIRLSGDFRLDFTRSAQEMISISGNRDVVQALRITVSKGVLSIARPNGIGLPRDKTIEVKIAAPALTGLECRGLLHARITGLAGPSFALDNRGSAAATISGNIEKAEIVSRGVASIDAGALHARDLTVLVRGQGDLRVFASHSATITMYGEGRVDVLGHPPVRQFKALGYGAITMK